MIQREYMLNHPITPIFLNSMPYSEIKLVSCDLAQLPLLIILFNFIKKKFEVRVNKNTVS